MTARDVYRALWRRKFLVVFLTCGCIAATWYGTSLQPKQYNARTLVRVDARSSSGDAFSSLEAAQVLAGTYAEVLNSGALNDRVRATVAASSGASPSFGLSASPVADLGLLWVTATARKAGQTVAVANAVPQALKRFARQSPGGREQVVVVKRASPPQSPASPDVVLNVVLAAILALIFNCGLALLIETLRDRLPDAEELRENFGYPVLTTVPNLRLRSVTVVEGTNDDANEKAPTEAHAGRSTTAP